MVEQVYYVRFWDSNKSAVDYTSPLTDDPTEAWLIAGQRSFLAAEIVRKDLGTRAEFVIVRIERYEQHQIG